MDAMRAKLESKLTAAQQMITTLQKKLNILQKDHDGLVEDNSKLKEQLKQTQTQLDTEKKERTKIETELQAERKKDIAQLLKHSSSKALDLNLGQPGDEVQEEEHKKWPPRSYVTISTHQKRYSFTTTPLKTSTEEPLLKTANGDEGNLSIFHLLELLVRPFREDEIWALVYATAVLLEPQHSSYSAFGIPLHSHTVRISKEGAIEIRQSDEMMPEKFRAPEYIDENSQSTPAFEIFSLGVLLWTCADYLIEENEEPNMSEELCELIGIMTHDNADNRATIFDILRKADHYKPYAVSLLQGLMLEIKRKIVLKKNYEAMMGRKSMRMQRDNGVLQIETKSNFITPVSNNKHVSSEIRVLQSPATSYAPTNPTPTPTPTPTPVHSDSNGHTTPSPNGHSSPKIKVTIPPVAIPSNRNPSSAPPSPGASSNPTPTTPTSIPTFKVSSSFMPRTDSTQVISARFAPPSPSISQSNNSPQMISARFAPPSPSFNQSTNLNSTSKIPPPSPSLTSASTPSPAFTSSPNLFATSRMAPPSPSFTSSISSSSRMPPSSPSFLSSSSAPSHSPRMVSSSFSPQKTAVSKSPRASLVLERTTPPPIAAPVVVV